MFERYSQKAKRAIFFARYQASQFGTPDIDTEHLLLGILSQDRDLLPSLAGPDVNETIRARIRQQYPARDRIPTSADLPFSEAGIRVLKYAAEEADRLGSRTIKHKHLLIGLLREEDCPATTILKELGVTREAIIHSRIPGGRVTGKAAPNITTSPSRVRARWSS